MTDRVRFFTVWTMDPLEDAVIERQFEMVKYVRCATRLDGNSALVVLDRDMRIDDFDCVRQAFHSWPIVTEVEPYMASGVIQMSIVADRERLQRAMDNWLYGERPQYQSGEDVATFGMKLAAWLDMVDQKAGK